MTLAMSVRVRDVRSSGYSCIRLKSDGDMMAGQRKRRKSEALIRRLLMSCWWPRASHCCFHDANTSFNSRGNTLRRQEANTAFITGEEFLSPSLRRTNHETNETFMDFHSV